MTTSRKSKSKEQEEEKDLKVEKLDEKIAPKFYKSLDLAILNAALKTTPGGYADSYIPVETARIFVNSCRVKSYVGHAATAKVLSKILHMPIKHCRDELKQEVGQLAIIFELNERTEEGAVLSAEDLDRIGYKLRLMWRHS